MRENQIPFSVIGIKLTPFSISEISKVHLSKSKEPLEITSWRSTLSSMAAKTK